MVRLFRPFGHLVLCWFIGCSLFIPQTSVADELSELQDINAQLEALYYLLYEVGSQLSSLQYNNQHIIAMGETYGWYVLQHEGSDPWTVDLISEQFSAITNELRSILSQTGYGDGHIIGGLNTLEYLLGMLSDPFRVQLVYPAEGAQWEIADHQYDPVTNVLSKLLSEDTEYDPISSEQEYEQRYISEQNSMELELDGNPDVTGESIEDWFETDEGSEWDEWDNSDVNISSGHGLEIGQAGDNAMTTASSGVGEIGDIAGGDIPIWSVWERGDFTVLGYELPAFEIDFTGPWFVRARLISRAMMAIAWYAIGFFAVLKAVRGSVR